MRYVVLVILGLSLGGCVLAGEYIDNRACNGPLPTVYKCK